MRISQTSSNPSWARIGRDIGEACVTRAGVPARDGVVPARRDERAVGASPTRLRQRRAAEERHAVLRERPRRARHRLAVDVGEVLDVVRIVLARLHLGRHRPAEGDRRDPRRGERAPRRSRRCRTSTSGGACAGGSLSTMPTASGIESSTSPSASRRSTRSAGVACVPTSQVHAVRPFARSCAWISSRTVVDLVGGQPEALRDVPARLVAAAHPEHVAVVRRSRSSVGPSGVYVLAFSASSSISVGDHRSPSSLPPRLAVDVLQVLDLLDVRARLGELDLLAVRAPAVDVPLAGVVRGEDEPLAVVLLEEVVEVPRAVADVDRRRRRGRCVWKALPPVRIAMPCAVAGVSCIRPIAPDDDFARRVELRLLVDHRRHQAPGRGCARARARARTPSSGAGSAAARTTAGSSR